MSACWTEHEAERTILGPKFVSGMFLGLRLGTNEMHIGTTTGVVRAGAIKRKTEPRTVCLGRVERSRGCTVETDSRRGSVQVMKYEQQGIPLQKAAAATTSAASREEDGTTPDCQGCDAILTRSTAENHGTQRRERLMT